MIRLEQVRDHMAVKLRDGRALFCFCFGVSRADFEHHPTIRDFIRQQTQEGQCSCETSSPLGRCCLKTLPDA
ncbi:hypothetical protein MAIT1_02170 [Magnetofaba australis IT-1]|uniref:CopZ zinc binding domain-containing protein n=1 Tax=Magnetofaba australis IT-1 TaxID=1434232 RepID=A0A1Y2K4L7_9PROT|nr:hypothetical protein MAIT1_02170 [Magnetofaba australis IT-1]